MSVDFTMLPLTRFGSGRRRLILALSASLALTACGRKGSLDLPPVEPVFGEEPAGDVVPGDDVPGGDTQDE